MFMACPSTPHSTSAIAVVVGSVKSPGVCHLSGTCQTEGSRICNQLNGTVEKGKTERHPLTRRHKSA